MGALKSPADDSKSLGYVSGKMICGVSRRGARNAYRLFERVDDRLEPADIVKLDINVVGMHDLCSDGGL